MFENLNYNIAAVLDSTFDDLENDFSRFDFEFIEYSGEEEGLESAVQGQMLECWSNFAKLARNGYENFGVGFVYINAKCFSMHLEYGLAGGIVGKTAFYIPKEYEFNSKSKSFSGMIDIWLSSQNLLDEYDPEKEIVFVIEFFDGQFEGVVGLSGEELAINP